MTPEDPKLEKYKNGVKRRRGYSKAHYSKKKAEPPTEEEKEEGLPKEPELLWSRDTSITLEPGQHPEHTKKASGIDI